MGLFTAFNNAAYSIYEALKGPASSYCRLETADDDFTLVADDGSLVSVMTLEGSLVLVSTEDFDHIVNTLTIKTQSLLTKPGTTVQVIFEYNPLSTKKIIETNFAPSHVTAKTLNMDIGNVLSDWEKAVSTYCSGERCWVVVWTDASCLSDMDRKKAYKDSAANLAKEPMISGCQKMSKAICAIRHTHAGAIQSILDAFRSVGMLISPVSAHAALHDLRTCLDPHLTGPDWSPLLPGDPLPCMMPDAGKHDLHNILYPSLKRQLFTRDAEVLDRYKVKIGDQIHIPLFLSLPPQTPQPFNILFRMLSRKKSGFRIPMRMALTIKPDGLGLLGFKNFLAQVLSFTSSVNKQFIAATEGLRQLSLSGYGIVQFCMCFDTWVDVPRYESEHAALQTLHQQMAELANIIQGWGTCDVQDVTGDPLLGVVATMPGMMPHGGAAPKAAAPLEAAWSFLPIRQASPWKQGPIAYRTEQGKLMPFAPNSSEQTAWIDLTVAPMGFGKSVLANVYNFGFCVQAGLTRFPWVSIVDVGPSSAGLISLLKAGLPPDKQYLAEYYRLKMTDEYAINPFDTPLGCREPLPSHMAFLVNFVCLMNTPLGGGELPSGIQGIAQQAIKATYDELAVVKPNPYRGGAQSPDLAEFLKKIGFISDKATTWWEVVDYLFDKGHIHEAHLAQRYAVPILRDISSQARTNEGIHKMYDFNLPSGEHVIAYFCRCLLEAQESYRILNQPTQFSLGDAQIVSLDLDEVAPKGGPSADRQSAIMYMLARHLLGSRFFLMPSDVVLMPEKYQSYHTELIEAIRQDPKRLFYDEAHRMMSDSAAANQIVQDLITSARESRKWNLSIGLCSQSIDDFPQIIIDLATVVHILGAGTERNMQKMEDMFGLNSTVMQFLKNIGKPSAAGSSFVQWAKTSTSTIQQGLFLTIGPLMLWALSSTTEDRTLRDKLYKYTGSINKTLDYLASHWPGGIKAEVERRKILREEKTQDERRIDVLDEIFNEVMANIMK